MEERIEARARVEGIGSFDTAHTVEDHTPRDAVQPTEKPAVSARGKITSQKYASLDLQKEQHLT